MPNCNHCQHLEDVNGGRVVSARCVALGLTFPAKGVSCRALGNVERRAEISPDTFSCACHLPKESPAPLPHSGVRVVNGQIIN